MKTLSVKSQLHAKISGRWFDVCFFCLLMLLICFVYRLGMVDVPRGDQIFFLKEHEFSKTNLEFFLRSLSYNRSAFVAQGDFFIFRPAFFGYLAAVSIFFREYLYASGLLSFLLHAGVSFTFFQLIQRVGSKWIAVCAAILFSVQYAGMEMLIWRHISPYMLGLIFFIQGLLMLEREFKDEGSRDKSKIIFGLFFTASLFHESFALFLLVLSGMLRWLGKPKVSSAILAAFILWAILNVLDFIYYRPNSLFGEDASSEFVTIPNFLATIFFLTGLFATVFLAPFLVRLEYENVLVSRASWDLTNLPMVPMFLAGTLLLLGLVLWVLWHFRKLRDFSDSSRRSPLLLTMGAYFIFFLLAFGLGRLTARTLDYLRTATYYFYFSNFFLLFFFIAIFFDFQLVSRFKRWLSVIISVLLVAQIAIQYFEIQSVLSKRAGSDLQIATTVAALNKAFKQRPAYCYGGAIGGTLQGIVSGALLLNQTCINKRAVTPLYMIWNIQKNRISLGELIKPQFKIRTIPIQPDTMNQDSSLITNIDAGYPITGDEPAYLSKETFHPLRVSVEIPHLAWAGLVVAYQDNNNFITLHSHHGQLLIFIKKQGIVWARVYRNKLISKTNTFVLTIRQLTQHRVGIFCDDQAIEVFPGTNFLDGRIGVYTSRGRNIGDFFKHLEVMDWPADTQEFYGITSVLEIPISNDSAI